MESLSYPSTAMIKAIDDSSQKYSMLSADELMKQSLENPFTNITPLN